MLTLSSVNESECEDFWSQYRAYENGVKDEEDFKNEIDARIDDIEDILQNGTKANICNESCNRHQKKRNSGAQNDLKKSVSKTQVKTVSSIKALKGELSTAKQMLYKMMMEAKTYKDHKAHDRRSRKALERDGHGDLGDAWCILQEEQAELDVTKDILRKKKDDLKITEARLISLQESLNVREADVDAREVLCGLREITNQENEILHAIREEQLKRRSDALLEREQEVLQREKSIQKEYEQIEFVKNIVETDGTAVLAEEKSLEECFAIISDAFETFISALLKRGEGIADASSTFLEISKSITPEAMGNERNHDRCMRVCRMIELCSIIIISFQKPDAKKYDINTKIHKGRCSIAMKILAVKDPKCGERTSITAISRSSACRFIAPEKPNKLNFHDQDIFPACSKTQLRITWNPNNDLQLFKGTLTDTNHPDTKTHAPVHGFMPPEAELWDRISPDQSASNLDIGSDRLFVSLLSINVCTQATYNLSENTFITISKSSLEEAQNVAGENEEVARVTNSDPKVPYRLSRWMRALLMR